MGNPKTAIIYNLPGQISDVDLSDTVVRLKERYQEVTGIPSDLQRLMYVDDLILRNAANDIVIDTITDNL